MCKIATITNITDETSENAWKFIKKMSDQMSSSDKDGFGYAAIDSEGRMFGERWKNPKEAFKGVDSKPLADFSKEVIDKFKGMLKSKSGPKVEYNSFGEEIQPKLLRSAILHARSATSPNEFKNTHPFIADNTCLIHNGVIRNTQELVMKTSTCDSETILNEYIKQGVATDVNKIQQLAHNLDGYYACAVYSKDSSGRWILDIFRDTSAKLHAYYIEELKCIVIATPSGYASTYNTNYFNDEPPTGPVTWACRDLGFKIVDHFEVEQASLVRIDAMTGEILERLSFDSKYKEKTKKGKKGKGGGGGSTNSATDYDVSEYGDVTERWNNIMARSPNRQKTWTDKQKDEELDRMLTTVIEGSDDIIYLPASKSRTVQEVNNELETDFIQDEEGVWHRKGTGTDRLKG